MAQRLMTLRGTDDIIGLHFEDSSCDDEKCVRMRRSVDGPLHAESEQCTTCLPVYAMTPSSNSDLEAPFSTPIPAPKMLQELNEELVYASKPIKLDKTVLEEAQALVYGDRQSDYGHPRDNMKAIAELWSGYLRSVLDEHQELEPGDVANMLLLMKIARYATGVRPPKRDTVADMAGYVAVLARTDGLDE